MKRQLISSIITLILTMLLMSTSIYAWFSNNDKSATSGAAMQIESYDLDMQYSVYKYDRANDEIIDATNNIDAFVLPEYDTIITSNNINTATIICFSITGNSIAKYEPFNINLSCENDTTKDYVISNIIGIKIGIFDSAIYGLSIEEIYSACQTTFTNKVYSFITNETKNTTLSIEINNYEEYVFNSTLFICLSIDYDEELIYNLNNGASYISADLNTTINFLPDLKRILLETKTDGE